MISLIFGIYRFLYFRSILYGEFKHKKFKVENTHPTPITDTSPPIEIPTTTETSSPPNNTE